jgi:nucleotide-binding universal stress UspA family protein
MYNILIPTDFSDNARKAVNYAIWLFQGHELNIFLFNAYGTSRTEGSMLISIDDILKKEADHEMENELKRVKSMLQPKMKVNGFVRNCTLTSYVNEVIEDWTIDLVILGTKGESGFKGKMVGSNATNVIRKVRIPILAVPSNAKWDDGGEFNIAFGSDLKPFEGRPLIKRFLTELNSESRKVQFEIFYISAENSGVLDSVKTYFGEMCPKDKCKFVNIIDQDIESGLEQYIKAKNPDLLMLVQRRDSFISRLLGNSVSQSMMLKAEMPMLVLHA